MGARGRLIACAVAGLIACAAAAGDVTGSALPSLPVGLRAHLAASMQASLCFAGVHRAVGRVAGSLIVVA